MFDGVFETCPTLLHKYVVPVLTDAQVSAAVLDGIERGVEVRVQHAPASWLLSVPTRRGSAGFGSRVLDMCRLGEPVVPQGQQLLAPAAAPAPHSCLSPSTCPSRFLDVCLLAEL